MRTLLVRKPVVLSIPKRFWVGLLVIPAAVLTALARNSPEAVERIYSTGIYPVMSGIFARATGLLPFSLAQWVVTLIPLLLIIYIIKLIVKIIKNKPERRRNIALLLSTVFCAAGVIWFGFTALCGLNYHRQSFAVQSGLDIHPTSAEELAALCAELAESANSYSAKVRRNEDGVMLLSFENDFEASRFASGAFCGINEKYPVFSGYTPRTKPVLGSKVMSLLNLVGVYFPFTFEANINADVPDYLIPSSMMHELAHYKGFMREDEANFISYLASVSCGNDDFAYSGTMLALSHSTNALYSADKDAYWEIVNSFSENIFADFRADTEYWQRFESPAAKVSEKVNDVYLKTNNQPQGVKSYGRMVDLLLADYRQRHGL